MAKKYLIVLAQEHFEFRIPELESVAGIFKKRLLDIWDKQLIDHSLSNHVDESLQIQNEDDEKMSIHNYFNQYDTPYILLHNVSEQDVKNIMSRTILAKNAYEIWGYGKTYNDMKKSILEFPEDAKKSCFNSSFCIRVKACGRKMSIPEQIKIIDSLEDVLPFEGEVDLKSPENEFHVIEDYGAHKGKKFSGDPHYIYFGRLIADGQRNLLQSYSVKTRKFIGNTSMDAGLSFIMSNVAKVKPGDYVCDPFVGTGSLLIAAARHGGFVTGGDINYNILHARGKSSRVGAGYRDKDETIKDSLKQYELQNKYLDVMVQDNASNAWRSPLNMCHGIFDAIITDPPYGIRERCRKVGKNKEVATSANEPTIHYPEQTAYHLDQVFIDLLTFAARTLVPGGRLVYWLPIYRPEYSDDIIPRHPNLKLLYNCEQPLKRETSRRLLVMEKCEKEIADCQTNGASFNSDAHRGHNAFRNKYFKTK
ncbi:tRNA (guanine(10)-N(2))-methyltransferase TRMT11-like [Styela clava]